MGRTQFQRDITGSIGRRNKIIQENSIATRLSRLTPSNVHIHGRNLSFQFDNNTLKYTLQKRGQVKDVGQWNRSRPIIYVDRKMTNPADLRLLAVHEGVERYAATKYHLDPRFAAHYVATNAEHHYADQTHQNWDEYMMRVEFIYRMNELKRRGLIR
jgi:hypothetical protein